MPTNKPRPGKPALDTVFSSGLSRLIGSTGHGSPRDIAIESIEPNPFNPRRSFDPATIKELVSSIQEHGFLGVLDGRRKPGSEIGTQETEQVEIAYGARRLLAAREAGLITLPVILHPWDDAQMRMIALVENVQRQDLTPLEEADAIGMMQRELGWSIRQIVRMTGKNKAWVEDAYALANAPEDVRAMLSARADTLRHAHYISRIADSGQRRRLIQLVEGHAATARQIQEMVQLIEEGTPADEAIRRVQKASAGRQLALGHTTGQTTGLKRTATRNSDNITESFLELAGDVPRPVAAAIGGSRMLELAIDELLAMQPGARLVMRNQLLEYLELSGSALIKLREMLADEKPDKSESEQIAQAKIKY